MPPLSSGSNPNRRISKQRSSAKTDSTATTCRSTAALADDQRPKQQQQQKQQMPSVKCVLVGNGAVGKTSLLVSYSKSENPSPDYTPTAFDNYSVIVSIDGRPIKLHLCDTAGQDELDSLRTLCYSDADVFLVCFSVVCRSSFDDVTAKWLPEIRRHCPTSVPIVVVGTQLDLRGPLSSTSAGSGGGSPSAAGQRLAASVGAAAYLECSAVTDSGVKDVFDAAIFAALDRRGFVRRCRRLAGIGWGGGGKRYRCRARLWKKTDGDEDGDDGKRRTRWKLFSCFSK